MMRYEFVEVLNDLIDYFLLGDIRLLQTWKEEHALADDLASEFISNESSDNAVQQGIVIPLAGIENYPYTVLFTLADEPPELLKPQSRLQHQRGGYVLRIENRQVMLFTWRILQNFTDAQIRVLEERYRQPGRPQIGIVNGMYEVEILAGEVLRGDDYEPAIEFVLKRTGRNHATAEMDMNYRFTVDSQTY
ncbi:hypothetical protein [Kosakonia sp. BK9b]